MITTSAVDMNRLWHERVSSGRPRGGAGAPLALTGWGKASYKRRHREPGPQGGRPLQYDPQVISTTREELTMDLTRRELLKGAAALGAAGAVSGGLAGPGHAQTTQKKELVLAQGGDISKF